MDVGFEQSSRALAISWDWTCDGTKTKTEWVKLPSVALMSFVVPADMTTELGKLTS
jgi:hypothetical protein